MIGLAISTETSDEKAMRKFQKGDAKSFDILLKRHSGGVLRFVMKMTGANTAQAEDLLQEIFLKVIERKHMYDSGQKFTTWLYSIARNHCIDYLRTESYRRHSSLDAPLNSEEERGAVVLEIVKGDTRPQDEEAYDKELRELIDAGVKGLKDEFREVFLLREVQGLSFQEIADITDSPLGTVKSRLRYAFNYLRKVFTESGYFEQNKTAKGGAE